GGGLASDRRTTALASERAPSTTGGSGNGLLLTYVREGPQKADTKRSGSHGARRRACPSCIIWLETRDDSDFSFCSHARGRAWIHAHSALRLLRAADGAGRWLQQRRQRQEADSCAGREHGG